VAPIMWETFITGLEDTANIDFPELLQSISRILSHISNLIIHKEDRNETEGEEQEIYDQGRGSSLQLSTRNTDESHQLRLQQLISAVPEDRLQAFSTSERSTTPTLQCLLERHKTLAYLHLIDISSLSLSEQSERMASSLSSITVFESSLPTNRDAANTSLQNCRTFIKNMPRLTWLLLRKDDPYYSGSSRLADLRNLLLDDNSTLSFSYLKRLFLASIEVSLASALLLTRIDFAKIRVLDLRQCAGVGQLHRLTVFYSSHEGAALRIFSLELDYGYSPKHVIHSVEGFLMVCPALRRLYINVCRSILIRTKAIISRHSKTLQCLTLITAYFPLIADVRCYSVMDIKSIIGQCVKLEGLAIDLPKADMGPLKGLGADFMLRHNNVRDKKEKTLTALSSFYSAPLST
jgi:hypothetical protein